MILYIHIINIHMEIVTDNRPEKMTHTWKCGNKISNIIARLFLSNTLPSALANKISRAASSADWICMFISICVCVCVCPACALHSTFLLSDQSLMEIPRQWGRATYQVPATFPDEGDVSLSVTLLSFPPLAHSPSPSLESNFTGSSKVAPSHLPKSQLHVVWRCQL